MRWLTRYWYVLLFVLVNLAIPSSADAGLKNAACNDGEGGEYGCCTSCWFFCACDFLE